MVTRFWALAVLILLCACTPAWAAPVTVQLRVEGERSTVYEGPVTTDGHAIQKDASGPHPCDGTNGGVNPGPGPTMTAALDDASVLSGFSWEATWSEGFQDFFVTRIGSDPPPSGGNPNRYWSFVLNGAAIQVGGCQQRVQAGDQLLIAYTEFGQPLLTLEAPQRVAVGEGFAARVNQLDENGSPRPAQGASVAGRTSGSDGQVALRFDSPGTRRLKAMRSDAIRSNAAEVCVYEPGSGQCGTPVAEQPGTAPPPGDQPPAVPPARDRTRPVVRITSPRSARHRRGPRLLAGRVRESGGIAAVSLRLRRVTGRGCTWYSDRTETFRRAGGCAQAPFFSVGRDESFDYLLPFGLPRGRYVFEARAVDRAGNVGTAQRRFSVG